MKSITSIFFAISILVLSFGVQAQDVEHRAMVLMEDGGCVFYTEQTGVIYGRAHAVGQYAGGPFPNNGKLTCQGRHDADLERPVVIRDFVCQAVVFLTDDTLFLATPGGHWSAQCNFPKREE